MSLRLEMLQVARLAPQVLGDSAGLVGEFVLGQLNPDGGFQDRAGRSDLYYTVFGLECALALQLPLPRERVAGYLTGFGDGHGLDFVHLSCLARCWAALGGDFHAARPDLIRQRLEGFRAQDGGYSHVAGARDGTAYGCFLAWGTAQDLRQPAPPAADLLRCLDSLRTPEGVWSNARAADGSAAGIGAALATAAAVTVLRQVGESIETRVGRWLLDQAHPQGGFIAAPGAPLPDLLSTATVLHALAGMQVPFTAMRESCLDFIDTLWVNTGAFHGHWADDHTDCEYTFYALLALGHLSL